MTKECRFISGLAFLILGDSVKLEKLLNMIVEGQTGKEGCMPLAIMF